MQSLTLTDFGLYLGKHSERLVVKKGKDTVSEHPLFDLEQVIVASRGISVSSDAIHECVERGIPITFLDFSGKPYAKVVSPALTATVKTRREQLMAYNDERAVEICRQFCLGKIQNQINLVRYFGKYRKQAQPDVFAELQELVGKMGGLVKELASVQVSIDTCRMPDCPDVKPQSREEREEDLENQKDPSRPEFSPMVSGRLRGYDSPIDTLRSTFLNLEGRAAALYWQCAQRLLPEGMFTTRSHRGATDDVNALLNYGYGILYSQIWSALTLAGLEPFGGFLHVDRPGKPSLVLDFIEEFRQPIVDRTVFASLNKGFAVEWEAPDAEAAREQHQKIIEPPSRPDTIGLNSGREEDLKAQEQPSRLSGSNQLTAETRKAFAARVLQRLEDEEPFEGKRHKMKHILQMQARHLATFLRREGEYRPFIARW